jgi:hypothetical protein
VSVATEVNLALKVIPALREPREIPLRVSRVNRVTQDRLDSKATWVQWDHLGYLVLKVAR